MSPEVYGASPFFLALFSHSSEYSEFERRSQPLKQSEEMRDLERDMEDAGQDPVVEWPKAYCHGYGRIQTSTMR
jgi:hypothetical protein